MSTAPVLLHEQDRVAWLVLNRPEKNNALNIAAWEELGRLVGDLADRSDVRAVVITGSGPSFSAGLDVTELSTLPLERAERVLRVVEETLLRIENLPFPTVAAIHGWTLGSGAELAMACDLRISADDLRFGLPVARLGIMISSHLLGRFVDVLGVGLTKELIFTGRSIGAEDTLRRGLVNRVVPQAYLERGVRDLLEELSFSSPSAIREAKRMLVLCQPVTMAHGLPPAAPYFLDPLDFQEGVDALLQRRRPDFGGASLANQTAAGGRSDGEA